MGLSNYPKAPKRVMGFLGEGLFFGGLGLGFRPKTILCKACKALGLF